VISFFLALDPRAWLHSTLEVSLCAVAVFGVKISNIIVDYVTVGNCLPARCHQYRVNIALCVTALRLGHSQYVVIFVNGSASNTTNPTSVYLVAKWGMNGGDPSVVYSSS
jgi:hypothetical protein